MKNIAIFGASRAGKSTLAKMICKKYPNYQMMIGDAVRKAFSEVLPQNQINAKEGIGMQEDFPRFLAYLFYRSIKQCGGEFNFILDTCDISPEKAKELFQREDTIIVFLGFPRLTDEQHLGEIRKYEKQNDWTYDKDEKYMREHAKKWTEKSKIFEKECKELEIWFVDTSFNREEVLQETMNRLEELIF